MLQVSQVDCIGEYLQYMPEYTQGYKLRPNDHLNSRDCHPARSPACETVSESGVVGHALALSESLTKRRSILITRAHSIPCPCLCTYVV
jgi:hypothetical protein